MSVIRIKQGDSLLLTMTFVNDDGSGVDLTNVTLSAQVRDVSDNPIAVLTIVKSSVLNVATVQETETGLWPPGILRADLKLVSGGLVVLSDTFGIHVNRAVTR